MLENRKNGKLFDVAMDYLLKKAARQPINIGCVQPFFDCETY